MKKLVLLPLLLSPCLSAQVQQVHVFWEARLGAALKRAARLQRPVLVALHADNKASSRLLEEVYPVGEVRSLLKEMVCVVACKDSFPAIAKGPRKGMSSVYLVVSAEDTQAVHKAVLARYLGDDEEAKAPQHIFLSPDGYLISREKGMVDAASFAAVLRKVLDQVDPAWKPLPVKPPKPEVGRNKNVEAGEAAVPWASLFSKSGKEKNETIEKLVALKDKNVILSLYAQIQEPRTKAGIFAEIRRQGGDISWAMPMVRSGLSAMGRRVRNEAAVTAQRLKRTELLEDLLALAKEEKDRGVFSEMLRAIAACADQSKSAREFIIKQYRHRNERVRKNAYIALAEFDKSKKVRETLVKRGLKDKDMPVRSAAIWALAELGHKSALGKIKKLKARMRHDLRRAFYDLAIKRLEGAESSKAWTDARRMIAEEKLDR